MQTFGMSGTTNDAVGTQVMRSFLPACVIQDSPSMVGINATSKKKSFRATVQVDESYPLSSNGLSAQLQTVVQH